MGRVVLLRDLLDSMSLLNTYTVYKTTQTHTKKSCRRRRRFFFFFSGGLDERRLPGDESGCHIANFRTLDEGSDSEQIS